MCTMKVHHYVSYFSFNLIFLELEAAHDIKYVYAHSTITPGTREKMFRLAVTRNKFLIYFSKTNILLQIHLTRTTIAI